VRANGFLELDFATGSRSGFGRRHASGSCGSDGREAPDRKSGILQECTAINRVT